MTFTYKYPRAALTVDAIVFRKANIAEVLLIQRAQEPYKEMWAFPGGFVDMNETVEDAVARELFEETGLNNINLKQFYTFSAIDRDPRHRTISVAFIGMADSEAIAIAGDDAKNAKWFSLDSLPELAFDHEEILEKILKETNELNKI
jgi:8-oxo-dGTP diphosphatase